MKFVKKNAKFKFHLTPYLKKYVRKWTCGDENKGMHPAEEGKRNEEIS